MDFDGSTRYSHGFSYKRNVIKINKCINNMLHDFWLLFIINHRLINYQCLFGERKSNEKEKKEYCLFVFYKYVVIENFEFK